jgi:hypothetical protein
MRVNRLLPILLLIAAAAPPFARRVSASIAGVVSDTSGARVPAAAIIVEELGNWSDPEHGDYDADVISARVARGRV